MPLQQELLLPAATEENSIILLLLLLQGKQSSPVANEDDMLLLLCIQAVLKRGRRLWGVDCVLLLLLLLFETATATPVNENGKHGVLLSCFHTHVCHAAAAPSLSRGQQVVSEQPVYSAGHDPAARRSSCLRLLSASAAAAEALTPEEKSVGCVISDAAHAAAAAAAALAALCRCTR